ncbi:Hpt domain-containing protein [Palleronia aestuarii]|uniref:Hpt domain-containing protein n=1 Tax=Palleronia aestuarii TaxID=568105 RepID=A0A2W7NA99_9RHOB|nr:Hpt domain-containing protein [Palleronia aestuarii]PZX16930.1 Hpt domain-containing protein [Palleronia aestuarii]
MREKILALVTRHCTTLKNEAAAIEEAMLGAGPDLANGHRDLIGRMHKLKGSSGSIGFHRISELCGDIEERLRSCADRPPSETDLDAIHSRHLELQRRIAEVSPEQSSLFARFS